MSRENSCNYSRNSIEISSLEKKNLSYHLISAKLMRQGEEEVRF
ncbi:hypothetical protein BREVNS_0918 [Brevinematales bacterium NS]|nr:hypothetical protein BREVNS_0918 [Brevinematales bacterium NS]